MATNNINKCTKEYIRRTANKIRAIQLLGGKCKNCGNRNIWVLDFHHTSTNKNTEVRKAMSWEKIKKESDLCDLLCVNCHQEQQHLTDKEAPNNRCSVNKKTFLEAIKKFECEKCGYNKCYDALDFHHIDKSEKEFDLGKINKRFSSVKKLTTVVLEELDKCSVLCRNCHRMEHLNLMRSEKYKELIYDKVKKFWTLNISPDINLIRKLYHQGLSWKVICERTDISIATLSKILKKPK